MRLETTPKSPQTTAPAQPTGCIQSVFNPSCKPPAKPSCLSVGYNAAVGALDLPIFPSGLNPDEMVKAGATAIAVQHVIESGLVVPLRSSIVRSILSSGELLSSTVTFAPIIYQEAVGVRAEYDARKQGACATIWGK